MSKVLVIGPNYFNFLSAVRSAFEDLGWKAYAEGYDNPVHPYNVLNKLRWKFDSDHDKLVAASRRSFRKHIEKRFRALKPELVFIMNGDMLTPSTMDFFRNSARVALWFFDSMDKVKGSGMLARHSDMVFSFEQSDVEMLNARGVTSYFLPQAYDSRVYRPLGLERDIDILFIGNMMYSPKRKDVVNRVIAAFPDRKIEVHGLYQPWYKGISAWWHRPHKDIITNANVTPAQANRLYNRAKVVLNVHQEHQKCGANPRVFEILGSGAYQVCDANTFLEVLFSDGGVGLYHSPEEMLSLISEALEPGFHSSCPESGVLDGCTFETRMREVLDRMGF